jgi:hypothetical protein
MALSGGIQTSTQRKLYYEYKYPSEVVKVIAWKMMINIFEINRCENA